MDVIKKKTTPNSAHYIIQTRPGYYPSRISNEIVADFKRGLITHETTLSATRHLNSKNKHANYRHTSNVMPELDFNCSISMFDDRHQQRSHYSHKREGRRESRTNHNHFPKVYTSLNKSNEKTINYFNRRIVVLPSSNFRDQTRSYCNETDSFSENSSSSSNSDEEYDVDECHSWSHEISTQNEIRQNRFSSKPSANIPKRVVQRSYALLEDDLLDEPKTDITTEFMFKSKRHGNDENHIRNDQHTDICTEFNSEQKKAILKQLADLATEKASMKLKDMNIDEKSTGTVKVF